MREFSAGDNGFEPLLIAPEAIVLPLDESPMFFQRAVFYHAHWDEARLFTRSASGIVLNIHKNQEDFPNRLNTNEIPQARQGRLQKPQDLLGNIGEATYINSTPYYLKNEYGN